MKKALVFGLVGTVFLSSCSLLQRHDAEEPEETAEESETRPPVGGTMSSEISRLNTKIAALETKLDVLTTNLERIEMHRAQPVLEAQAAPEPTMSAPVEVPAGGPTTHVSAAPARLTTLPGDTKNVNYEPAMSAAAQTAVEKEFRAAMVQFQNGKNMEASSAFALLAKKYPQHLLASHALYWAGEASARSQQWSMAAENWEELEKRYPRSSYLPEALVGLARAYDNQGDAAKAKSYRETVVRAFPKAPVVLGLPQHGDQSGAPLARAATPAGGRVIEETGDEPAPAYEPEAAMEDGE